MRPRSAAGRRADGPAHGVREAERRALRDWYRPREGAYPWRRDRDPYRVLVSEVMLQQTQASRVAPAYRAFVRRFPTVGALAAAGRGEVVRAWGSLGYVRRAVSISEAARAIVRRHGGQVPTDPSALSSLPGVGPYTAAAVASIAHGVRVPAIDTNVRRVVARARLGVDGGAAGATALRAAAEEWLDASDPGSWNQALMDLGREVCRPAPRCASCPLATGCRFRRLDPDARRSPPGRRPAPFGGSSRQVRGAVVRTLRERGAATLGAIVAATGDPLNRVAAAAAALAAEGVLRAGPAALDGAPRGRVRLE